MATEPKRGCGYRKVGGTYLVSEPMDFERCDREIHLEVCPCCGGGIKQSRAWTWIDPIDLFEGDHKFPEDDKYNETHCICPGTCPMCYPTHHFTDKKTGEHKRAGLIWIGEKFYKTPADFIKEARFLGVSRRLPAPPKGFKVGDVVFLAHPKAVTNHQKGELFPEEPVMGPGIFMAYRPKAIERIVNQSEYELYLEINRWAENNKIVPEKRNVEPVFGKNLSKMYGKMRRLTMRGITLVPVPDDDPDHH